MTFSISNHILPHTFGTCLENWFLCLKIVLVSDSVRLRILVNMLLVSPNGCSHCVHCISFDDPVLVKCPCPNQQSAGDGVNAQRSCHQNCQALIEAGMHCCGVGIRCGAFLSGDVFFLWSENGKPSSSRRTDEHALQHMTIWHVSIFCGVQMSQPPVTWQANLFSRLWHWVGKSWEASWREAVILESPTSKLRMREKQRRRDSLWWDQETQRGRSN